MNIKLLLIDITITFFAFTLAPLIRFGFVKNLYTYNQKKKFIIWNSIIVQILFITLHILFNTNDFNITPAFIYYFINYWLWCKEN